MAHDRRTLSALAALPVSASDWHLVWSDEFNGPANSAPDPAKWTFDLGGGGWGNVIQIGPLPHVKLLATVKNVDLGGATELEWDATHATRCEASGAWSGGRGVKGEVRVVPAKTGSLVYTLTCFGPIGTGSATATVTVTP